MRIFIFCLVILVGYIASASAEGPVIDPTRVGSKTLLCEFPTEYTDGTPLDPLTQILSTQFYRAQTPTGPWVLIGTNVSGSCDWTENISIMEEGQYYYMARVTDILGLQSGNSNIVPLEVRILPPPMAPVNLRWAD